MGRQIPAIAGVTCHLFLWCWVAVAQEKGTPVAPEPGTPPPAAPAESAAPAVGPVERASLGTIHLKDKNGKLVPVPNWTFEAFEEEIQQRIVAKQRDQKPRFILQSISAVGIAHEDHVQLTVEFKVLVRDEQGVRVPLRLDPAVLGEGRVEYDGPSQPLLAYVGGDEGYVIWIPGKPGEQQHQFKLNLLVPLTRVGDETRMIIAMPSMPRATSSELNLTVPLANAVAEVSSGAVLKLPAPTGKGITEFAVQGLGGDFEIVWRKADGRTTETRAVLQAEGAILATIDSRVVDTEAKLTVRSHGAPFDRFRVRLPVGAKLVDFNPIGYSVVSLTPENADPKERRLIEVRLPKPIGVNESVDVRLPTRQIYQATGGEAWFELAGFEVVGAVRQSGHIAVVTGGDWDLLRRPSHGVRQVDEVPEALRHDNLAAGFEYFSQPCTLFTRVVPRTTRIRVEPKYLLLADKDQVRLEATLKYTVRGKEAYELKVGLSGWEFDEAGPDNVVNVDGTAQDQSGLLSIPLRHPSTGETEVTITAHRKIAPDTASLLLSLPRPEADSADPAEVVVLPADNLELTPDTATMVGLIRQSVAPPMDLPQRQQDPLYYRTETAEAAFAAKVQFHDQRITVDVTSEISVIDGEERVEQKLAYQIDYVPLEELTVAVPRRLAESQELEFLLEGEPLASVDLPETANPQPGGGSVHKRIALPSPWIGRRELLVRYPLEPPKLQPQASIMYPVPLVMPVEGELSGNKLYAAAGAGVRIQNRDKSWDLSSEEPGRFDQQAGLQLATDQRTGEVLLGVHLEDRDALGSTVVQRAWIQTWLTEKERQDRAVFRFTSDQKHLELIVPEGADPDDAKVILDGESLLVETTPQGRLVVALPRDANGRPHSLELWYRFSNRQPARGQMSVELPRVGRDVPVRRMYWQLVLPRNEHVIVNPKGFTPEFTWRWHGAFWGRISVMEQPRLETWVGTANLTPVPEATSRYLFSSLGPAAECELRTASRTWIVAIASGIALLAGLVLINVPATRHPLSLFVLTLLLAGAAVLHPAPTLLLAQAASVGLALVVFGGLLHRSMARGRHRVVRPEISSSVFDKGSTQTQYPAPVASSPASTETNPAPAPLPTSDSHS